MDGKLASPAKPRKKEFEIRTTTANILLSRIDCTSEQSFHNTDEATQIEPETEMKPEASRDRIKLENSHDGHVISNPNLRRPARKRNPNSMNLQLEETDAKSNTAQLRREQLLERMIENKNYKIDLLKREQKEFKDKIEQLKKTNKEPISLNLEVLEAISIYPSDITETKQTFNTSFKETMHLGKDKKDFSQLLSHSANFEIELDLRRENNDLLSKLKAQNNHITNLISRIHRLSIDNQYLKESFEYCVKSFDESELLKLPSLLDKLDSKLCKIADKVNRKDSLVVDTPFDSSVQFSLDNTILSEDFEKIETNEKLLLGATIKKNSSQIESLFDKNLELSLYSSNLDAKELFETKMKLKKENDELLKQIYEYESEKIPSFTQEIQTNLDYIRNLELAIESLRQRYGDKETETEALKTELKSFEYPIITEDCIILHKFEHRGVEWVFLKQGNSGFWIEKHRINQELADKFEASFAKSELFPAVNKEKEALQSAIEDIKETIAANKPVNDTNEIIKQLETIQNQYLNASILLEDRDLQTLKSEYETLQREVKRLNDLVDTKEEVINDQSSTISSLKGEMSDIKDKLTFILESYKRTKNQELIQLLEFIRKIFNST